MSIDPQDTEAWIRNASDEVAVANGCYFDVERGAYTVWWIERYCRLYEGEHAGESMLLRSGCPEVDVRIPDEWDNGGREASVERARRYAEWFAAGNHCDWQYECMMRLFGWARHSEFFNRDIRRFRRGIVFISKKNKKTPTLAATGLYLTCGDGEPGAKSFAVAKDGGQACIAMEHAIKMVQQSPELSAECKINQNEKSITHVPTNSVYRPLATNNSSAAKSQEGRNGNLLIDEIHVVDRDSIKRLKRAKISRSEPMQLEVSTAGNDPDGYGKETQDYARQVVCAAQENDEIFAAIYEAPQGTTDEELAADPIKYGKMANPAWGHTIDPSEYMGDYRESRRSISELADFKMYRLNIWQATSNQWLRLDDWLKCGQRDYDRQSFAGQPVAMGMDLSKTRDMSALAVSIPHEDKTYLFVDLWMTESYARGNADKAAFLEWQASGELNLIPGEVIQESFLRARFAELCKLFKVKVLIKDKTYAADFTEWCEENYPSVLQVDYPQNAGAMEKPIDDFEADIIDGMIAHDNNGCLTWQAGHASVFANARGYRLIQKPKPNDVRKVDGIVSAVMAHWGTKHLPKKKSVYKRRGVLCR